jgi:predicted transposase/invertase (TIGR01784 family)
MVNKKKNETNDNDEKMLNNPHDRFFKAVFSRIIVVQDYFNHFFPKHLLSKLNIDTLESVNTSYITPELEEFYSDIVWRCQFKDKKESVLICFIFEHKSYVPKYPHVQIGDYKQGAYNKQIKEKKPLQLVVPIIVYHGLKPWPDKPFSSYFGDIDESFLFYIDPLAFHLTNLQDYSDDMIKAFNAILLGKAMMAYKHFLEKEYISEHLVELLLIGYENNNSDEEFDFVHSFYLYLYTISGGFTNEQISKKIEDYKKNQNSETMVNYLDVVLERGIEKGIEKGIERGIEKGEKRSIYKMWLADCEIVLISRIFALPEEQISERLIPR